MGIDVILPIGYESTIALSRHITMLPSDVRVPVPDWASMKIACNKASSVALARELGIPVPRCYSNPKEVDRYPVVVKNAVGSGSVRYANSPSELTHMANESNLVQEYIPGEGYGFFALFCRGSPRAIFMHRRLREYPVTGGAATAAISVYDSRLRELGLQLLTALRWHGVAMVEFKKDARDGRFKLMEINPKFWGSLDLSIACGVDFPYLAVQMAATGDVEPVLEYEVGRRFHWPFPDEVLHALAKPSSIGSIVRDSLKSATGSNVWRRDLMPTVVQAATTLGKVFTYLASGTLRYPHGKPGIAL